MLIEAHFTTIAPPPRRVDFLPHSRRRRGGKSPVDAIDHAKTDRFRALLRRSCGCAHRRVEAGGGRLSQLRRTGTDVAARSTADPARRSWRTVASATMPGRAAARNASWSPPPAASRCTSFVPSDASPSWTNSNRGCGSRRIDPASRSPRASCCRDRSTPRQVPPRRCSCRASNATRPDRWQQLRLADVPSLLAAQARVMRTTSEYATSTRARPTSTRSCSSCPAARKTRSSGPMRSKSTASSCRRRRVDELDASRQRRPCFDRPRLAERVADTQRNGSVHCATRAVSGHDADGGRPAVLAAGHRMEQRTLRIPCRPRLQHDLDSTSRRRREQSAEAAQAGLWLICHAASTRRHRREAGSASARPRVGVAPGKSHRAAGTRVLPTLGRTRPQPRSARPRGRSSSRRAAIGCPPADSPTCWSPITRQAARFRARTSPSGCKALPLLARPGTPFWASIPTQPGAAHPRTDGRAVARMQVARPRCSTMRKSRHWSRPPRPTVAAGSCSNPIRRSTPATTYPQRRAVLVGDAQRSARSARARG